MEELNLRLKVATLLLEIPETDLSEFENFADSSECGSDWSCPTTGCR